MRYLGSKTRLVNHINKFIVENNINGNIFCDIFAGTSTVGDYFKGSYKIIANDFTTYSTILSKAKLLNADVPKFAKFVSKYNVDPFTYFNEKEYKYENNYFITNNYSPKGGRKYLSESNSIKIDGIRLELEELYKNGVLNEIEYSFILASLIDSITKVSNTTGTYEAFLKNWDSRAEKNMKLAPIVFNITTKIQENEIHNLDANKLIRKIKGDILYIDPPYTITEYGTAYHMLETISKYDFPEIAGLTGRRKERINSTYTRKQNAILAFEDLIRQANFKHIIISYSNQSIIPLTDLESMLKKYSVNNKVKIKKIPFREYKNIRESKKRDGNELYEVLIYIEKNREFIKSPLNYSGSKDSIIPQIHNYLPANITTFVDMMGGAFNVGVNIVADTVQYNEYNPFVYDLVNTLISVQDKKSLIKQIEKIICENNLEKSNSNTYTLYREKYNNRPSAIDLFVLTMFCFQNQIRFNNNLKFNTPVGNCAYNETTIDRLLKFIPKTRNVKCTNLSFEDIKYRDYDKNTLFYFDPPYFITNATYNDGKRGFEGWTSNHETKLLEYIATLNEQGYKFILSNVIEHKGKVNHILKEWCETNNFNVVEISHSTRKEVIIYNYELDGGVR